MADAIKGKVWNLDTAAGVVTLDPVTIHGIYVRFTTAAAGSFQMVTGISANNSSSDERIIDCVTATTDTSNATQLNQFYTMGNQTFRGLKKILSVNVATIIVYTCNPD